MYLSPESVSPLVKIAENELFNNYMKQLLADEDGLSSLVRNNEYAALQMLYELHKQTDMLPLLCKEYR